MTGFSTYPALLDELREHWALTNSEAGLIGGSYFAGYMLAVPFLTSLTDRVDARRIYGFSSLLSSAGGLGFALFANGSASAIFFQALVGAGLAGTYMPGVKILSDHIAGKRQSRAVAFYTSSFGVGGSMSLLLADAVASAAGSRSAFAASAIGPLLAGFIVYFGLPERRPFAGAEPRRILSLRPVLRNRAALPYIFGYAAHCWELFGLRSWMVAFVAFSATLGAWPWSAASVAAAINLLGPAASILGNELALKLGRERTVPIVMASSALIACGVGYSAGLPWWLVFILLSVHFVIVMADSAALTAGVVAAADPRNRGATMAAYSLFGFGAGFLAPLAFGVVLDFAGGAASTVAWGLAFASLGAGCLIALPIWLRTAR